MEIVMTLFGAPITGEQLVFGIAALCIATAFICVGLIVSGD
jgi:hypothetical protein